MFRRERDLAERSRTRLKNKEARRVRQAIVQQLGGEALEEAVQILYPSKDAMVRVTLASKAVLYVNEAKDHGGAGAADGERDLPYFVQTRPGGGDGERFFPTIFALWRCPAAFSAIYVAAPVSQRLMGGADVMLPGVLDWDTPVPQTQRGDVRAIRALGNPLPFAVGRTLMDGEDMQALGMKGKGIEVLHCFGDALWRAHGEILPNPGFSPLNGVLPLAGDAGDATEGGEEVKEAPADSAGAGERDPVQDQEDGHEGLKEDDAGQTNESAAAAATEDTGRAGDSQLSPPPGLAEPADPPATVFGFATASGETTEDAGQEAEDTVGEMTALLDRTLMRCLKYCLRDKDLPMLANVFYAGVCLPCRPAGTVIDVKRSAYRKVSTFLQSAADRGWLAMQNVEGVITIMSVNREHDDYRALSDPDGPALRDGSGMIHAGAPGEDAGEADGEEAENWAAGWSASGSASETVQITRLYKLSRPQRAIFGDVRSEFGQYVTAKQVREQLFAYVERERLQHPTNGALIQLDPALYDTLFSGLSDEKVAPMLAATGPGDRDATSQRVCMHKGKAVEQLLTRIPAYHARYGGMLTTPVIKSGDPPTINVRVERRQGNRFATRVTGLAAYGASPDDLVRDAQRQFACSASSVAEGSSTGKPRGGRRGPPPRGAVAAPAPADDAPKELIVQGNLGHEMTAWLTQRLGLPAGVIDQSQGKGVAKKKKAGNNKRR